MAAGFTNGTTATITATGSSVQLDGTVAQAIANNNTTTAVTFNNVDIIGAGTTTLSGAQGFIINGTTTVTGGTFATSTAPLTNNGTMNASTFTLSFGSLFTNGATGTLNSAGTFGAAASNKRRHNYPYSRNHNDTYRYANQHRHHNRCGW
jgi:hypothetical protein